MMEAVKSYLTKGNVATVLILLILAAGTVKVAVGDLQIAELIKLMDIPVVGLAIGAGATAIKFEKALPGEELVPLVTLVILVGTVAGAAQCIFGSLTFEAFVKTIELPVAGLAVGRGLAANNSVPPGQV